MSIPYRAIVNRVGATLQDGVITQPCSRALKAAQPTNALPEAPAHTLQIHPADIYIFEVNYDLSTDV